MFVIPPYEAGVTLHSFDGTPQFFASRRLLYRHLGWSVIRRFVGPTLNASAGNYYVIRGDDGDLLSPSDFTEFRARPTSHAPSSALGVYLHRAALREKAQPGPVPGTGRRSGGNAYRSPRTRAERRDNIFYDRDEGEPAPRGARSWKTLVSSWDDLVRSDYGLRSWKHFRTHQWKD